MNLISIRENILEHTRNELKKVLEGTEEEFVGNLICPKDCIDILRDLGAENLEVFNTNGWQWDFWDYWKFNDRTFCLSGSGYYGGIRFYPSSEHEEL